MKGAKRRLTSGLVHKWPSHSQATNCLALSPHDQAEATFSRAIRRVKRSQLKSYDVCFRMPDKCRTRFIGAWKKQRGLLLFPVWRVKSLNNFHPLDGNYVDEKSTILTADFGSIPHSIKSLNIDSLRLLGLDQKSERVDRGQIVHNVTTCQPGCFIQSFFCKFEEHQFTWWRTVVWKCNIQRQLDHPVASSVPRSSRNYEYSVQKNFPCRTQWDKLSQNHASDFIVQIDDGIQYSYFAFEISNGVHRNGLG